MKIIGEWKLADIDTEPFAESSDKISSFIAGNAEVIVHPGMPGDGHCIFPEIGADK